MQSLEFLKKSWNLPRPGKIWKLRDKVWKKIVISSEFFFQSYSKCFLRELMFLFWSNLIQSRPQVCSKPWKKSFVPVLFLRTLLITYLITLSLEKGIIVWKKVWKKSWILDPKICANPVKSITCFTHLIEQ